MTTEPNQMQQIAEQTAKELTGRIGVDVAFVVTMRLSDDSMGCGIQTPATLPYDAVIGCVVQLLGQLRVQLHEQLVAQRAQTPEAP